MNLYIFLQCNNLVSCATPQRDSLSLSLSCFSFLYICVILTLLPSSLYPHFTFLHSTTLEEVFKTKKTQISFFALFPKKQKNQQTPTPSRVPPLSLSRSSTTTTTTWILLLIRTGSASLFPTTPTCPLTPLPSLSFTPLPLPPQVHITLFPIHAYSCSNIDR